MALNTHVSCRATSYKILRKSRQNWEEILTKFLFDIIFYLYKHIMIAQQELILSLGVRSFPEKKVAYDNSTNLFEIIPIAEGYWSLLAILFVP